MMKKLCLIGLGILLASSGFAKSFTLYAVNKCSSNLVALSGNVKLAYSDAKFWKHAPNTLSQLNINFNGTYQPVTLITEGVANHYYAYQNSSIGVPIWVTLNGKKQIVVARHIHLLRSENNRYLVGITVYKNGSNEYCDLGNHG